MRNYSLYDHPNITTFSKLISMRIAESPTDVAFQYTEKKRVVTVPYSQFQRDTDTLCAYFHRKGFVQSKVAVLGENSYYWILTYFAIVLSSNIIVPIDKDLGTAEIGDLLACCKVSALVCSDTYMDIAEELHAHGAVNIIYNMKDFPAILSGESEKGDITHIETDENAVCTIIFTSGTTGTPKGVMLTQKNMMLNAINSCRNLQVRGGSVLTLPLHHAFGFTVGVLAELIYGYPIYISRGLRTFNNNLKAFHPQNLIVVPLYVETMYKNIWKFAREQNKDGQLNRLIILSNFLKRFGIDLRRKFFRPILEQFGGNLEEIICGGAYLDQKYIDGLNDIGIQVLNGYGITECSPVVAVNRNEYSKRDSVGLPLPGCEVKIVDGEICVKGDIVMVGYYQDDAATREVIEDGWFKTGDMGYQDGDGFLFITGRKKNLIILSNGKNVSPEELEAKILQIAGVQEVIVSAEDNLIVAEIYASDQSGIQESISVLNKELPSYKRIHKVKFRPSPFEKTTTQKIKRT